MTAAEKGDAACVKHLIEAGADENTDNESEWWLRGTRNTSTVNHRSELTSLSLKVLGRKDDLSQMW